MYGFSCLMLIFGILILLAGYYIYTGHNSELLLWKTYRKDTSKSELREIGKWTMISGLIPLLLSLIGFVLKW